MPAPTHRALVRGQPDPGPPQLLARTTLSAATAVSGAAWAAFPAAVKRGDYDRTAVGEGGEGR